MLFDLWGRGYSDSVDLPHDGRLYATQIMIALVSSPLAWTPGGFSLVGYSLGGGIVVDFAAGFPELVESVVCYDGPLSSLILRWRAKLIWEFSRFYWPRRVSFALPISAGLVE